MSLRLFVLGLLFLWPGCPQETKKDEDFKIPREVLQCEWLRDAAEHEVNFCHKLCNYPAYCCTVERCKTSKIALWNASADWCAEWGVTAPEILWPKPTKGKLTPECDVQQETND